MKKLNKFFCLLLVAVMLAGLMPAGLFGGIGSVSAGEPTARTLSNDYVSIGYTATSDGSIEEIGDANFNNMAPGKAYLISLPYGATVDSFSWTKQGMMRTLGNANGISGDATGAAVEAIWSTPENYLVNEQFKDNTINNGQYDTLLKNVSSDALSKVSTENVMGFSGYVITNDSGFASCFIFVQISTVQPSAEPTTPQFNTDNVLQLDGEGYEIVADYTASGNENVRSFIVRVPTDATSIGVNITEEYANLTNEDWDPYWEAKPSGEYHKYTFADNTDVYTGSYSAIFGDSGFADYADFTYDQAVFIDEGEGLVVAVYFFQSDTPVYGGNNNPAPTARTLSNDYVSLGYTATSDGTIEEIGTIQHSATTQGKVYLASLPAGAQVTSATFTSPESAAVRVADKQNKWIDPSTVANAYSNEEQMFVNDEFSNKEGTYTTYGTYILGKTTFKGGFSLPTSNVKGFVVRGFKNNVGVNAVFIQISTSGQTADKTALATAISSVPAEGYYTSADRYNGKTTSTNGFWAEMQTALSAAQEVNANASATQAQVDAAAEALTAAIANLIPTTQVNATALYELSNARYVLGYTTDPLTGKSVENVYINPVPEGVSPFGFTEKEEWTELSRQKSNIDAAEAFAKAELAKLYDASGEPTAYNKAALQEQLDEGCAFDLEELVLKSSYDKFYELYKSERAEALSVLSLYDPALLTEADYTPASWQSFVEAYERLKTAEAYEIEGGSRADYDVLYPYYGKSGVSGTTFISFSYLALLKTAYRNLTMDRDITVDFTYINNFYPRYFSVAREQDTDVYHNAALNLTAGSTTLASAIDASSLTFYAYSGLNAAVDAQSNKSSQCTTVPLLAVYINGMYVGSYYKDVLPALQLHDGDKVTLLRVSAPFETFEQSSGEDSTSKSSAETGSSSYSQSIAVISIDSVTQGVKVGDTFSLNASVTGAHATNLGKAYSAEDLTLFVSAPAENGDAPTQGWQKTNSVTEANGKTQYIFTEPGWYTIGLFNLDADVPTFTDVYSVTTYGTYPSQVAGAYKLVYVAPADDEAALIVSQRSINLAKAEKLFEGFADYDFEGTYYNDTFKPLYEALVANQQSAATFKALMDSFNADYAALEKSGLTAYDHAALIANIRELLRLIPEDLSSMDNTYAPTINSLKTRYAALNEHQKSMLTANEKALLEELKLIDAAALPETRAVTVTIERPALPYEQQNFGVLTSASNEDRAYLLYADGKKNAVHYEWSQHGSTEAQWNVHGGGIDSTPDQPGMAAHASYLITARRYIVCSDEAYWIAYSVDNGATWQLSDYYHEGQENNNRYFQVSYVIPQDYASDTLNIKLKTVSKAEYENMLAAQTGSGMNLDEAKQAYSAALKDVYASYDKDLYSTDNYRYIKDEKDTGLTNIAQQNTVANVVKAFNSAVAAMKAIPAKEQVHVIVENTTWAKADGAPWDGTLLDMWVNIDETSTMMSSIQAAVEAKNFTVTGADTGYISDINGVGEFGGGQGSGWMGTLNDWFVSEGFGAFDVKAGDVIRVMYTCAYGKDIGGSVNGENDQHLNELSLTNGTLNSAFDKDTFNYTFTLNEGKYSTAITYSSANKAFQSRVYLNEYTPSSDNYYTSGDVIPLVSGDVLYVAVGDPAWPSMGKSEEAYVYTISVFNGVDSIIEAINKLPAVSKLTIEDKSAVEAANAMFSALNSSDKALINDTLQNKLKDSKKRLDELVKVENVKKLIEDLPPASKLTYSDAARVAEANEAYEKLGSALLTDMPDYYKTKLTAALEKIAALKGLIEIDEIYNAVGKNLYENIPNPKVGSVGGEWAVLGLLRAGYPVSDDYINAYVAEVVKTVTDADGKLVENIEKGKYTEYSRVILALTSAGYDVTDVGGYNLLSYLSNYDRVVWQGNNGAIWALIAFDSHNYAIPTLTGSGTQTTRENLIAAILASQLADGGWAVGSTEINGDVDMTAMAIQALVPYYSTNAEVKAAVDKALALISSKQTADGDFGSWGTVNSESTSQVLVALTALNIDPTKDARFIKNGNTVVDALLTYYAGNGGFKHTLSGDANGMATEQAYYALTAYYRFVRGEKRLYDMSDVNIGNDYQLAQKVIEKINALPEASAVKLTDESAVNSAIVAYNALTTNGKSLVTNLAKLNAVTEKLDELKAAEATRLIEALPKAEDVKLTDEEAIVAARTYYSTLTDAAQKLVKNLTKLTDAEAALKKLKDEQPEGTTKSVTVTIKGVTYEVSEATKKAVEAMQAITDPTDPKNALPEDFADLTEAQEKAMIEAYKLYEALTPDEKLFASNFKDFEETVLKKLGETYHYDEETKVDLRANSEEALPWNIKLIVKPQTITDEQLNKAREVLGEEGEFIVLWDISFLDVLTGKEYHPESLIEVKLPMPNATEGETIVIVHIKDDGTLEYIEGRVEGGYLVFTANDFSLYGIATTNLTWEELLPVAKAQSKANLTWLWIAMIVIGAGGIATMLFIKKRREHEEVFED